MLRRKIAVSQSSKAGLPPGTLQYVGERDPEPTSVRVFVYGPDFAEEKNPECLEELLRAGENNIWINVSGLFNLDIINRIGKLLKLHPLTLEDLLNTEQRPKYEDFDDYIFLVLKIIRNDRMPVILLNLLLIRTLPPQIIFPGNCFSRTAGFPPGR